MSVAQVRRSREDRYISAVPAGRDWICIFNQTSAVFIQTDAYFYTAVNVNQREPNNDAL